MTLDPPHHIDKAPRSGSLAGSTRQLEMRGGHGVLDNLVASSLRIRGTIGDSQPATREASSYFDTSYHLNMTTKALLCMFTRPD